MQKRNENTDAESVKKSITDHLTYTVGKDDFTATTRDWFYSTAHMTRDRLTRRWMETMRSYYAEDVKRVYYLSMEFLMGRMLMNSVLNLGLDESCREVFEQLGIDFGDVREMEHDAALGNGGLGRLAACFLDSMATLDIPGTGYGIRYEYGMFSQKIEKGQQVERPDNWLRYGNPWEFPRPEVLYPVRFHGRVVHYEDETGRHHHWVDTDNVMAMAYDMPVPGYDTNTANNLRLWSAKATREFELEYFNEGNYIKAVEDKNESENLSKVLYPNDTTEMGRELRLKQQYFFVCASLNDILHRFEKSHESLDLLPEKVAIQLNDTHPSIAVAELMRILLDEKKLDWDRAWKITRGTFSYTNHTLMPEAMEVWPIPLFGNVLPRHLQIIYEINQRFLDEVMHTHPGDIEKLQRMSLIDEKGEKSVRMAHLAIVGSHKVNGVSALHTELLKDRIFPDFEEFCPGKFVNVTNGITPRRWLNQTNPALSGLITSRIGKEWVKNLSQLEKLIPLAEDASFREEFFRIRQENKHHLVSLLKLRLGLEVSAEAIFDVQVKRIHEYKRQLLNLLHVIALYNRIRNGQDVHPRVVIFSGKAAPGYAKAKLIIKLINDVADIVNRDPHVGDRLKVVFIPNYDVTTAQDIIPASDLSEQISTAGTEASGTGNMKLALNGALTIGTLDGANIEILQAVGEKNIFIFGNTAESVQRIRQQGYNPYEIYQSNPELKAVLDMIASGFFSADDRGRYAGLVNSLLREGDPFMLLADYASYIACQKQVEEAYRDREGWVRKSILNVANMGRFSSDRTIEEYATRIWNVSPLPPTTRTDDAG